VKYLHLYSFASELPHYLKMKTSKKKQTRNLIQSICLHIQYLMRLKSQRNKSIHIHIYIFVEYIRVLSSFKPRRQKISMGAHRFPLYWQKGKIFWSNIHSDYIKSAYPFEKFFLWNFLMSDTGHCWLVIKQECLRYQVTKNGMNWQKLQDIIHNSIFSKMNFWCGWMRF
jgi:hypothetical protein